jgi:hypothetical protein
VLIFGVIPHWNSILGAGIILITIIMMTFIKEEDIINICRKCKNRIRTYKRSQPTRNETIEGQSPPWTVGDQYQIQLSTVWDNKQKELPTLPISEHDKENKFPN